jgi:alanyl aminopeptidase
VWTASALCGLFALSLAAAPPEPPAFRLPDTAKPVRYAIDLTIVPDQDTFRGIADIDLTFARPSSVLWLNATDLIIDQASFTTPNIKAQVILGGANFVGFAFDSPIAGNATLHVSYQGKISRSTSAGLFQMRDGSRPPWYVYSQFEPTDARRAFPCFDEPKFKTPWQLTLHVKQGDFAASNTPILSETREDGGMRRVTFAVTRPLPSYLVALVVGPFDVIDLGKAGRRNTPLRLAVPQGRGNETAFARSAIPELLKLLEKYFDLPYPYEKLDGAIMPVSNFAMENAGLITYGASEMLAKPETTTLQFMRECAVTAAHEMSHQWFGDSVTTSWWDDIWLNEAFATWMENKITGEWKPEWKMDVTEVRDRLGAMDLDDLVSARRIRQPIESENDIANAFDGITYQKGAAVIEMFERWLGEKSFQKGVRSYLREHADGNAVTPDFLASISQAAGHDVAPAFSTFLDQAGVPLVSVDLRCDPNKAKPRLALTQSRSLPIGSQGSVKQAWTIPICVQYSARGSERHECSVLNDPSSEMTLTKASGCPAWLLANDGEGGYYRVLYHGELLDRVMSDRGSHLSIAERVGLLGDVSALIDSGGLSPAKALALVEPFSQDSDWRVVSEAVSATGILRSQIVPEELRPNAAHFLRKMFGERARELGWTPQPGQVEDSRALRQQLVALVARDGEDPELIADAQKLALRWIEDRKAVDAQMAGPVMYVAASHGDQALFDRIHAAALMTQDRREREILLYALASFRDPALVKQRLALLLTNEFDLRESFSALLFPAPRSAPRLPFEFVRDNLDALLKKLPREVGSDFAADLPRVGEDFCNAADRDDLDAFFKPRVDGYAGGPRTLAQTLEGIDLCIARKKALEPSLAEFLKNY